MAKNPAFWPYHAFNENHGSPMSQWHMLHRSTCATTWLSLPLYSTGHSCRADDSCHSSSGSDASRTCTRACI